MDLSWVPKGSLCKSRRILCEYVTLGDDAYVVVEECRHCGKKVRYNKDNKGRIDNEKYLKEHLRDFLQPRGRQAELYGFIYGYDRLKERQDAVPKQTDDQKIEEARQRAQDALKTMKRKSF